MKFLPYLKTYAALIGAIVTGLLGTQAPDSRTFGVLAIISAIATAIVTFQVPYLGPDAEVTVVLADETGISDETEADEEVDEPLPYEFDPDDSDPNDYDFENIHGGDGTSGPVGPYSGDLSHEPTQQYPPDFR